MSSWNVLLENTLLMCTYCCHNKIFVLFKSLFLIQYYIFITIRACALIKNGFKIWHFLSSKLKFFKVKQVLWKKKLQKLELIERVGIVVFKPCVLCIYYHLFITKKYVEMEKKSLPYKFHLWLNLHPFIKCVHSSQNSKYNFIKPLWMFFAERSVDLRYFF